MPRQDTCPGFGRMFERPCRQLETDWTLLTPPLKVLEWDLKYVSTHVLSTHTRVFSVGLSRLEAPQDMGSTCSPYIQITKKATPPSPAARWNLETFQAPAYIAPRRLLIMCAIDPCSPALFTLLDSQHCTSVSAIGFQSNTQHGHLTCDAIVMWWTMDLVPGVTLSTTPGLIFHQIALALDFILI